MMTTIASGWRMGAVRAGRRNRQISRHRQSYDGTSSSGHYFSPIYWRVLLPQCLPLSKVTANLSNNTQLTTYSFGGLIACLLTWFNIWDKADIIRVGTSNELILSTVASIFGILTCIVGWAGILLNNRSFLAVYCFLSWVTFGFQLSDSERYLKFTFSTASSIEARNAWRYCEWFSAAGTLHLPPCLARSFRNPTDARQFWTSRLTGEQQCLQ